MNGGILGIMLQYCNSGSIDAQISKNVIAGRTRNEKRKAYTDTDTDTSIFLVVFTTP